MNLTRRREGRKDSIIALLFPIFTTVIPAKAGIQRVAGGAWDALIKTACRRRGLGARDTLILAFSHEGLAGVGLAVWERGRPAGGAALARGAPSS